MSSGRCKDGNCRSLQHLQDASPSSLFTPALIATDHRLPGSEAFGKVSPRRTGAHDPEDGLHDLTMLNCRTSGGGLRRQEGTELFPSLCCQFLQACHRNWLEHSLRWKRMASCTPCLMATFRHGLMPAAETGPAQTHGLSPVPVLLRLPQAIPLLHRQRTQFSFTIPFFPPGLAPGPA